MPIDAYYTSPEVASALVEHATTRSPDLVADFCAGTGGLLQAAIARWPRVKLLALDHDPTVIPALEARLPGAEVLCADFFSAPASEKIGSMIRTFNGVSVIVANPPFSCRGGTKFHCDIFGQRISCGLALSFIIHSMRYLSESGEILAILPASCLHSEKDNAAMRLLDSSFDINEVGAASRYAFRGCAASTSFVRFRHRKICRRGAPQPSAANPRIINIPGIGKFEIFRGSISMHTLTNIDIGTLLPFVHTSELLGGRVLLHRRAIRTQRSTIKPPAILIPRVGAPRKDKICIIGHGPPVALSDCVLAVRGETMEAAEALLLAMRMAWGRLEALYIGTGARYLTVHRLSEFLSGLRPDREEQQVAMSNVEYEQRTLGAYEGYF